MTSDFPAFWACGSGVWHASTVIVAKEASHRLVLKLRHQDDVVVATPLDVISRLEDRDHLVTRVVLADRAHPELEAFLRETYPDVEIIAA